MASKNQSFFANGDKPASAIAGFNVYKDDKGRNVLYQKSTGTGYILQSKDRSAFTLYHNRLAMAVAVFMLLTAITNNWQMSLLVGIVLYALLEFRYRKSFLPSLSRIDNFKPAEKHTMVKALVEMNNKPRTLLLAVLYLLFGILLVIYMYQQNRDMMIIIGSYVVLAGCVYMSVNYFIAFVRMCSSKQ